MIEAAAPRDELEGALAVQMACTHTAAMSVLAEMDSGLGTERRTAAPNRTRLSPVAAMVSFRVGRRAPKLTGRPLAVPVRYRR